MSLSTSKGGENPQNAPIRVAQVVGKLTAAGVEAVINNYYRCIDHDRYQFDYYIDADSTTQPPEELIALGARYYVIPPYQKPAAYVTALTRAFRERGYTIVHSNMNTLSVFSLFAAWRAKVPVRIIHSHSTAAPGETKRNVLKYTLRPFAGLFATHLCACSNYAGEWLYGKRAMASGRVEVFNNAIDTRRYAYDPEQRRAMRRELGLEDHFVVGHVGRFCFQKNHDFLIDIFAEVHKRRPDAVLMLVGDGGLREQTLEKAKRCGLEASIRYLGIRNDVQRLYQAMDVFALPSHYEGLPVVGVEAQAAGLPCLFSDAVTREALLLPETRVMALSEGAARWAEAIVACASFERRDTSEDIRRQGFDIRSASEKLAAYYDKALSEQCAGKARVRK